MCVDVMSAIRLRCPDCRALLQMPCTFCPGSHLHAIVDKRLVARLLLEHAHQAPILHPTVLAEHHLTGRRFA
jgi:hypothetical protein